MAENFDHFYKNYLSNPMRIIVYNNFARINDNFFTLIGISSELFILRIVNNMILGHMTLNKLDTIGFSSRQILDHIIQITEYLYAMKIEVIGTNQIICPFAEMYLKLKNKVDYHIGGSTVLGEYIYYLLTSKSSALFLLIKGGNIHKISCRSLEDLTGSSFEQYMMLCIKEYEKIINKKS